MTHPLLPPHQDPILRMDLNLAPRQCLIHFGISTLFPVKRTPGSFESHVGDGQVHVVMRHSLPAAHTEQHALSRVPVQNSTMTFRWRGLAPPHLRPLPPPPSPLSPSPTPPTPALRSRLSRWHPRHPGTHLPRHPALPEQPDCGPSPLFLCLLPNPWYLTSTQAYPASTFSF